MNEPLQPQNFRFAIGGSRLENLSAEWERAVVFPECESFIKEEAETLIWRQRFPDGTKNIVKLYRRRSWHNWFRGGVLLFRAQREFIALCALYDAGIPCSEPVFWGHGWAKAHGLFEVLVTREIPETISLKDFFSDGTQTLTTADLLPLFDIVRRMHERGIYHGALLLKNILITNNPMDSRRFYMIDLARTLPFPNDIRESGMAQIDLLNLLNGLKKRCSTVNITALLECYGCSKKQSDLIVKRSAHYKSSAGLRNRRALMFQLGSLWARVF